jgi:hypothetical protein
MLRTMKAQCIGSHTIKERFSIILPQVEIQLAPEEAFRQILPTLSFLVAREAEHLEVSQAIKAFQECLVKL